MQCNALLTSAITDSASHYVLIEAFNAQSTGILGSHSLNSHTCTLPPVGSDLSLLEVDEEETKMQTSRRSTTNRE